MSTKSQNNLLSKIEEVVLMGPGPSMVHESVYKALSTKTLGHLDPFFLQLMDEIKAQLRKVFQTSNEVTLPVSGTGSAGMETSFVNIIEKDDPVLILINGVFGMRMKDLATRLGADVDFIEFEWGTPVVVEEVQQKIQSRTYKMVAVVHAETSTGVVNPVKEIGNLLRNSETLYLVDTVTSLGGMDVRVDEWNIDIAYSGTQKCLSCPPGLAPVTLSDRAINIVKNRQTKVPNWYLDLTLLLSYWEGEKRAYHHTAPVNMNYGLYQALHNILEEGLEDVFIRHSDCHHYLVDKICDMGLKMLVDKNHRLPMLNTIIVPENADEELIRKKLRKEHKIEIGAGLGPMAGNVWRVGIMGETARPVYVDKLIHALKQLL